MYSSASQRRLRRVKRYSQRLHAGRPFDAPRVYAETFFRQCGRKKKRREKEGEKEKKKEEPFHERRSCKIYGGESRKIRGCARGTKQRHEEEERRKGESNLEK